MLRLPFSSGTRCRELSPKERIWKVVKTKIITQTRTSTETQTEVIYKAHDGAIITQESNVERSDPTHQTTANQNETFEEVDATRSKIIFNNLENTETVINLANGNKSMQSRSDITHVQEPALTNNIETVDVLLSGQGKSALTTSRDTSIEDKDISDSADDSANEPGISTPASSNSTSSSNSDDPVIAFSTKGGILTKGASLSKQKRQRSVVISRTSRSPMSPLTPCVLRKGARVFALWYDK